MRFLIIQPPAQGLVSGGYHFNAQLGRVLHEENRGGLLEAEHLLDIDARNGDILLIDSLFLGEAAPTSLLEDLATRKIRIFLLAHYLPLEDPTTSSKERRAWKETASGWMPYFEGILSTGKRAGPLWGRYFPSAPGVQFLPPAIDCTPADRTPSRDSESRLRLVTVGALSPSKNQKLILDALSRLPQADFEWDLAGSFEADPAYTDSFVAKVRKSGMRNRIHLHGCLPPDDCRQLISQADCYVSASLLENFGMATAEALAMEIPVISFEVGDILEWIRPGEAGWIPEVGDSAAFQGALRSVLTTPEALRMRRPKPSLPVRNWSRTAQILGIFLGNQR